LLFSTALKFSHILLTINIHQWSRYPFIFSSIWQIPPYRLNGVWNIRFGHKSYNFYIFWCLTWDSPSPKSIIPAKNNFLGSIIRYKNWFSFMSSVVDQRLRIEIRWVVPFTIGNLNNHHWKIISTWNLIAIIIRL